MLSCAVQHSHLAYRAPGEPMITRVHFRTECSPVNRPGGSSRLNVRLGAVKRVPSTEAFQLLQSGLPYLDVRTPEEFASGHAGGAVNIPYWLKSADGMMPNPHFLQQVQEAFPDNEKQILVGCRSGTRSAKACAQLEQELSYSNLIDDTGGWLGWMEAQLPVELPA